MSLQCKAASGLWSKFIGFDVFTFGMSCYGFASEADWGTPPDNCKTWYWDDEPYSGSVPTPAGNLPPGTYCSSFVKDLKTEGSGYLANGTRVRYAGNDTYVVLNKDFTTHDTTPLVPWATVARDLAFIPVTGVKVDLDGIGDGLSADDTGGAILGWRLDLFGGLDTACYASNPVSGNPIVVGACTPGNFGPATCPTRIPKPPQ
jgi:3D (Asp-Asp-Asp) domain-containing protein